MVDGRRHRPHQHSRRAGDRRGERSDRRERCERLGGAIKRRLGRLDAPDDLLPQLERARVELLPISARHADRVATLPPHHRDPFDRLLVAQAASEALALVTADESLRRYDVDVVW